MTVTNNCPTVTALPIQIVFYLTFLRLPGNYKPNPTSCPCHHQYPTLHSAQLFTEASASMPIPCLKLRSLIMILTEIDHKLVRAFVCFTYFFDKTPTRFRTVFLGTSFDLPSYHLIIYQLISVRCCLTWEVLDLVWDSEQKLMASSTTPFQFVFPKNLTLTFVKKKKKVFWSQ